MAFSRPSNFADGEVLTFRRTPLSDFRVAFTFVEALNEGTLFDRSSRVFEVAARSQRLFEAVVGEDRRIIATGMLQDSFQEAGGRRREEELGGIMVHPGARGLGIASLLIKLMLVHRHAVLRDREADEDYIAHVLDGNRGPIHALQAAGFQVVGPVKLHPGEFDGAIEHMMAPGEDFVPMHAYQFDHKAIDNLVHDLWRFWMHSRMLRHAESGLRLEVDFSDLVDPAFLDAEVRCRGLHRG